MVIINVHLQTPGFFLLLKAFLRKAWRKTSFYGLFYPVACSIRRAAPLGELFHLMGGLHSIGGPHLVVYFILRSSLYVLRIVQSL